MFISLMLNRLGDAKTRYRMYKKYLSSFLFECQIASRVEFKVTLVTFNFTFLMSNHSTFCRSIKVTLVTFTCIFTHALQITSCVDFKAMLVTFNFTFLRVSPQITCRKGFKVAVVTFEFICFMSIQITSRRTFKVTWSHLRVFVFSTRVQFKVTLAVAIFCMRYYIYRDA